MNKITIKEKFELFTEEWTPKIIAESNGQLVKIAKGSGDVVLNPGEMYVVPKGVEHCPKAQPNTHFMMIKLAATAHTGEVHSDVTVSAQKQSWI